MGGGRDHHVTDDDRVVICPEHLGYRESVHVGIEQPDLEPGLGQRDGQVHRHRRLADAALARRHPDDTRLRIRSEKRRHGRGGRVPVSVVVVPVTVVTVLLDAAGGLGPQPVPQTGALLFGHHHEVELDLLHSGHGAGGPVDLLGELLGAGPGGHRQGHLYLDPATAGSDGSHQAELTQRQADLGLPDSAHCCLEL